jgi:uncharacterized protein YbjT (DUF2867 family)
MRIAITGGTGFVGSHLAAALVEAGHEVVVASRGGARPELPLPASVQLRRAPLDEVDALAEAFAGADAVAHLAGINRERGGATYEAVHVQGTRNVIAAAQRASVSRLVLLSFLRARPRCGSGYHESKWAAEELVRGSGLEHVVVKAGMMYGRGDHMLDHISRALHTVPLFGTIGVRDRPIRPLAVADAVRVLASALSEDRLVGRDVSVVGPEQLAFGEAVRRVAGVIGRRVVVVPTPLLALRALAWAAELVMPVPLVARAQVRILEEGFDALPGTAPPPHDLAPRTPFDARAIREGLPPAGGFRRRDFSLNSS